MEMLDEDGSNIDCCDDIADVVVKLLIDPELSPAVPDSDELVGVDTDAVDRVAAPHDGVRQLALE